MDEEKIAELMIAFKQVSPRTMSLSRDAIREGLLAVLEIVNREPDPGHEFQEWNDAGNMCHVPNCRLEASEHEA